MPEAQHPVLEPARVRAHLWRLVLLFTIVLLALWGFGVLAEEMGEGETLAFDVPMLLQLHALASPRFDGAAVAVSRLGFGWGVIPCDAVLVLMLVARRRWREAAFAATALAGSGLLSGLAKQHFERIRPALWVSPAPEATYSFPSGHAMASMTLAMVLLLLAWNTRWRWPVAVPALVGAVLVAVSRMSLGVHYPTDILAGWSAAIAWTVGVYAVLYRGLRRPWSVQVG